MKKYKSVEWMFNQLNENESDRRMLNFTPYKEVFFNKKEECYYIVYGDEVILYIPPLNPKSYIGKLLCGLNSFENLPGVFQIDFIRSCLYRIKDKAVINKLEKHLDVLYHAFDNVLRLGGGLEEAKQSLDNKMEELELLK